MSDQYSVLGKAPGIDDLKNLSPDNTHLTINKLSAGYGKMEILHDFNLTISKAQSLCLIGPNGAGKSTILHSIYGFTNIFSGKIEMDGKEITKLTPAEKLKSVGIAYILQDNSVFPDMTVEENLLMGGYIKEKTEESYKEAENVGEIIIKLFSESQFDVCKIFYNKFKNVITQIPQEQQIIPIENQKKEELKKSDNFYEFEPEENEILNNLLPRNISTQIFKAFLENAASEQGSRMTAMDSATRNAGDLVDKLTITYNRSRQAAITKELIEIISGAESL